MLDRALFAKAEPLPYPEEAERKPPLKRAVQLIKRWRDVAYRGREALAPSSIVLTTLAATHYQGSASVVETVGRLLDSLVDVLACDRRLQLRNPAHPTEDLLEDWGHRPGALAAFSEGIREFRERWVALGQSKGIDRLTSHLEWLFGDEATAAIDEQVQLFEKARSRGQLGVRRGSGRLTAAGISTAIAVPPNTFYGDG